MRKLIIILTFGLLFGCSPKIKTILEYRKNGNEFVLNKLTEFDKNGNKVLSKGYGNERMTTVQYKNNRRAFNIITTFQYKNNRRIFERSCDYIAKQDTCIIRDFSKFQFDKKTEIEKKTLFKPDSTVQFIQETKRLKDLEIKKGYIWTFSRTKSPKTENAPTTWTDTTYFDKKGRKTKIIHHSSSFKKPWFDIFKYSKNEYTKQTIRFGKDTILKFKISDLQKLTDKKNLDYKFYSLDNYKYEIKNY